MSWMFPVKMNSSALIGPQGCLAWAKARYMISSILIFYHVLNFSTVKSNQKWNKSNILSYMKFATHLPHESVGFEGQTSKAALILYIRLCIFRKWELFEWISRQLERHFLYPLGKNNQCSNSPAHILMV